jgi:radical SAM protein with 4Fe4S-binding SPASM domain
MKKSENIYLLPFVKLIRGVTNSILIDIKTSRCYSLENNKIKLKIFNNSGSIDKRNRNFIQQLINYKLGCVVPSVLKNEIRLKNYPETISQLNQMIIEFGIHDDEKFQIINQAIKLGVDQIECRFSDIYNFFQLEKRIKKVAEYCETSIIVYETAENLATINEYFINNDLRVVKILKNENINLNSGCNINLYCGFVSNRHFIIDKSIYNLSLKKNSCLYKKISIDNEGNIKNCPSMTESFGNIKDTTLAEAIEKPGFKKYWDINKDKIHVCKDCEFRYICTDCRAYVEDPEDILSKPLKCGYNPYTGEWSEWSTNPLKQKAIDFYSMREMVNEMKVKIVEE